MQTQDPNNIIRQFLEETSKQKRKVALYEQPEHPFVSTACGLDESTVEKIFIALVVLHEHRAFVTRGRTPFEKDCVKILLRLKCIYSDIEIDITENVDRCLPFYFDSLHALSDYNMNSDKLVDVKMMLELVTE